MARKGENIYKRKDGRWEGRYKKGRKPTGQLMYGYVYGKKYMEVKEKLHVYQSMYQTTIEDNGGYAISYKDWANSWLAKRQVQLKSSTHSTYIYKLNKYVYPIIGSIHLNRFKADDIQYMVDEWEGQGLAASTIHVLYQIVKKILKDAYSQKMINHFPCENIILPKKNKMYPQALTKSEQKRLEAEAKSAPLHEGLPVFLALDAGLRIGEVSALRWEDIDFETKTIHIRKSLQRIQQEAGDKKTKVTIDLPKTDRSIRSIPMSSMLYDHLKKWHMISKSEYVCSNKRGPAEPRLITYYFNQIRSRCSLEKTHFHHLRHTFATRCIESSPDIASVSRLLGHTSSKTTLDVYTDSFIEGRKRVIFQMEEEKKR